MTTIILRENEFWRTARVPKNECHYFSRLQTFVLLLVSLLPHGSSLSLPRSFLPPFPSKKGSVRRRHYFSPLSSPFLPVFILFLLYPKFLSGQKKVLLVAFPASLLLPVPLGSFLPVLATPLTREPRSFSRAGKGGNLPGGGGGGGKREVIAFACFFHLSELNEGKKNQFERDK